MSVLNKKHTKLYILRKADLLRGGRFSRISKNFLLTLEYEVEILIDNAIRNHPSKGKTLDEFRK